MTRIDARIPLRFASPHHRRDGDAVLTQADLHVQAPAAPLHIPPPAHPAGCACCTPRSQAALALAALFRARATGNGPAFRSVLAIVGPLDETAIRAALLDDPVVSSRYRLE